jgi:coenzyme F420-reducing hydrogenase alpha subunit
MVIRVSHVTKRHWGQCLSYNIGRGGEDLKKKYKLSRQRAKSVREVVSEDLETYDMHKWKLACKGFGPIHYVSNTRKMWLEKNRYRIEGAREIVDFVGNWVTHFRNRDEFENYTVAAVRQEIILVIRKAQQKIKNEKGILNGVKLNGFKTLVKWADNPKELRKGPYKGRASLPKRPL